MFASLIPHVSDRDPARHVRVTFISCRVRCPVYLSLTISIILTPVCSHVSRCLFALSSKWLSSYTAGKGCKTTVARLEQVWTVYCVRKHVVLVTCTVIVVCVFCAQLAHVSVNYCWFITVKLYSSLQGRCCASVDLFGQNEEVSVLFKNRRLFVFVCLFVLACISLVKSDCWKHVPLRRNSVQKWMAK